MQLRSSSRVQKTTTAPTAPSRGGRTRLTARNVARRSAGVPVLPRSTSSTQEQSSSNQTNSSASTDKWYVTRISTRPTFRFTLSRTPPTSPLRVTNPPTPSALPLTSPAGHQSSNTSSNNVIHDHITVMTGNPTRPVYGWAAEEDAVCGALEDLDCNSDRDCIMEDVELGAEDPDWPQGN